MLEKYRATVLGNKIEWEDEIPTTIKKGRPQKVDVILVLRNPKLKNPTARRWLRL